MRAGHRENIRKFYFIGIGGVSMSALAKYLLARGLEVSGSDMAAGERTEELISLGVRVFVGSDAENPCLSEADEVVYTSAVSDDQCGAFRGAAGGKARPKEVGAARGNLRGFFARRRRGGESRKNHLHRPCARTYSKRRASALRRTSGERIANSEIFT